MLFPAIEFHTKASTKVKVRRRIRSWRDGDALKNRDSLGPEAGDIFGRITSSTISMNR